MEKQDILQRAKENYSDAQEAIRDQNARFREDLKFSNPADPQQWDDFAVKARRGRPMLTLDRTNQFVAQIVNDARQNKPSIQTLPVDSQADIEVAKRLNGIIRHIEYASRAGIAYDMALELAARVGLGWLRVIPKIVRPETNEQEITIQRVHDPMSICLDPNSVEPDGSDAMWGFAETLMTEKAFKKWKPKAAMQGWDTGGWFSDKGVRVCEYFEVEETKETRIAIDGPDGARITVTEEEYWQMASALGFQPVVHDQFTAKKRAVNWHKLSGAEQLEETEFPSIYVPLIPVLGYETWVDGKRFLCGMVRRMMDGQRLHNYEASAQTEAMMAQPKAPFLLSGRAVEGHEDEWGALNSGNPAYITYNDVDANGQPINQPTRLAPPAFPAQFGNGNTRGAQEMEASVGMSKTSLGMPSNAVSGRAKLADLREADTANFHYSDNLRRSMEHMGRIIVSMIPVIYDEPRQAKIMGEDGEPSSVEIDPKMEQAVSRKGGKVVAINPSVGTYDVRVKVGPSYTTAREEASDRLTELAQGNPQLGAALAPLIVKMHDMPEADKIARVAIALLPENVQGIYNEDEQDDIPPAAKQQLTQQGQQIEQMAAAMDQSGQVIQDLQQQLDDKGSKVQDEVRAAMAEIKAAQDALKNEAALLAAKERELADATRIAQLELKLQVMDANNQATAHAEGLRAEHQAMIAQAEPAEAAEPAEQEPKAAPVNDQLIQALASVVMRMNAPAEKEEPGEKEEAPQLAQVLDDAMQRMALMVAASKPETIEKIRGKDGKLMGARITQADGTVREVSIQ